MRLKIIFLILSIKEQWFAKLLQQILRKAIFRIINYSKGKVQKVWQIQKFLIY